VRGKYPVFLFYDLGYPDSETCKKNESADNWHKANIKGVYSRADSLMAGIKKGGAE
jgi:hypothetical protein